MDNNKVIFLLYFFLAFTFGCHDDTQENSSDAYIGGEIVNPTTKYTVLLKNNKVKDTLYLDQANRFKHQIKNIEPGIFIIKHGSDAQIVHIAQGDSILLRANTLDFDESLHFSGDGAEKNNFLINMFLQEEANTHLLLSSQKLNPKSFAQKTDSIEETRLKTLKELNGKYHFSGKFMKLAKRIIGYEKYDLRERYTYIVKAYNSGTAQKFPPDFYDYRNTINFNDKVLQTSPRYIRFIEDYLINKTRAACIEQNGNIRRCYNVYSSQNIIKRIKLLDEVTTLPILKAHLYTKLGAAAITMAKTLEETQSILESLKEKGLNKENLQELKRLAQIQSGLIPGTSPKNKPLINSSGDKIVFQDIISKPSIIYIWSLHTPSQHEKVHEIIKGYRKKYPEINFIGLNIDLGETKKWINTIKKYDYDRKKEFQLGTIKIDGKSIDKSLFEYYRDKLFFLNANGEIVIGDAYLFSPKFETRILEFLNQ